MTTLYRPVLIKSVEQAEALPVGVFAIKWATPWIGEHRGPDDDGRTWWESKNGLYTHSEMVGDTALVPIDAEEEWTAMGEDHGDPWIAHIGHDGIDGTREEAEAYVRRFGGLIAHRALTLWEAQD